MDSGYDIGLIYKYLFILIYWCSLKINFEYSKVAKKEFACNGTVVEHPEYGEVIQLQVHLMYTQG